MTDYNSKPLNNLNCNELEKGQKSLNSSHDNTDFDEKPVFKNGIAVVKRGGKYGAIMMGGKEILPPIYDMLSEFKDGFATATYNREKRLVNLSGQIQVLNGDNAVFLPEAFEWGFDFTGKFFVVKKNGKYGVIDNNFDTLIDFIYDSYFGFRNGCLIFGNTTREIVFDNNLRKIFYIEKSINNDAYVVSDPNSNNEFVGLTDNQWNLLLPIEYKTIVPLQEKYYLIIDDKGRKGLTDSSGNYIVKMNFQEIEIINNNIILSNQSVYVDDYTTNHEYTLFNANGDVLLKYEQKQGRFNEYLKFDSGNNESIFIKKGKETFRLNCKGEFFLIDQNGNTEIQVSPEYIHYSHKSISDTISIIEKNDMYGLSDNLGKILIPVQYIFIEYWKKDLLIAAKIKEEDSEDFLSWGIIDFSNKYILPFIYSRLRIINSSFCAFSHNLAIKRTSDEYPVKYYVPGEKCPSYVNWIDWNNYHRSIHWHLERSDYYEYHIREIINWGLISSEPKEIFPSIFDGIKTGDKVDNNVQQNLQAKFDINSTIQVSLNGENTVVNANGEFVLSDPNGKELLISSSRFDWCMTFGEHNYAKVIKHGLEGKIDSDGNLVSLHEGTLLVVPKKYDWAYDFSYGYVPVLLKDKWGIADANFHPVIPAEYTGTKVINDNFFIVCIDKKYGVVNLRNEIIVSINYDNIIFDKGIFVVKKDGKFGCVNESNQVIIPPIYDNVYPFNNKYYKVRIGDCCGVVNFQDEMILNSEFDDIHLWGVMDTCNNTIPLDVENINTDSCSTLFILEKQEKTHKNELKGLADSEGHILLPAIFYSIEVLEELLPSLYFKVSKKEIKSWFQTSNVVSIYRMGDDVDNMVFWDSIVYENGMFSCERDGITNLFNRDGEILLNWRNGTFIIPSSFSLACSSDIGLFRVLKNGKWGVLNIQKQIIVPNKYALIGELHGSYAIVGVGDGFIFSNDTSKANKDIKYGLIDLTGKEVIPTENESIHFFDNGYIGFQKDGLWGLMTASLSLVVDSVFSSLYLFDNWHFVISNSNNERGLIDCNGNTIIPLQYFDKIEISEDGYYKVTFNGYLQSRCKLYSAQGKVVLGDDDSYEEISYKGNGLNLVRKSEWYDDRDEAYYYVYNLCNVNGKEILPYFVKDIVILDNGYLSIRDKGWGMADITGKVFIEPNYENELAFENGVSPIKVKDFSYTHKINFAGNVLISDKGNSICLPREFYWGTEFVNGLSIVRSKKEKYKVGVVNDKGDLVLPARYDKINIMSNQTIVVVDESCYGIADGKGNFFFPPIFHSIKYLSDNRIIVKWNTMIAKSWNNNGTIVVGDGGPSKSYSYPHEYDRIALCDAHGNILNDKSIVYINKFENGYAKAYKEIFVDENGRVRLSQAGIVDMDGKIVLEPRYKRIDFHSQSYALAKDNHYSIFRLTDRKLTCFKGEKINHIWPIDSFGIAEYTSTGKYNSEDSSWDGDRGVLGIDGIIVRAGKYDYIEILSYGVILVAKEPIEFAYEVYKYPDDEDDFEKETRQYQWYKKWGLINYNGEVIAPCVYSYHTELGYDNIILCKGGDISLDKYGPNVEVKGGEWSVYDVYEGKLIKVHSHDEAYCYKTKKVSETDNTHKDDRDKLDFDPPRVLLSDSIKRPKSQSNYTDYRYDDEYDADEGPYRKYGGYNGWDDNTIDEAFDGNPELTWNID